MVDGGLVSFVLEVNALVITELCLELLNSNAVISSSKSLWFVQSGYTETI